MPECEAWSERAPGFPVQPSRCDGGSLASSSVVDIPPTLSSTVAHPRCYIRPHSHPHPPCYVRPHLRTAHLASPGYAHAAPRFAASARTPTCTRARPRTASHAPPGCALEAGRRVAPAAVQPSHARSRLARAACACAAQGLVPARVPARG